MTMQSGGCDYEFVHTPSDTLTCQICHCLSKEPHLSACCGHTFCRSCLEAAKRVTSVTKACPICRSEEFATIPNKQADHIIRSLHVYCSNKNKGCQWQGEVIAITGHLNNNRDGCQFQEVSCSNDCGKSYQRRHLTGHLMVLCPRRKVNCQYCHDVGEHQFIKGQHKEKCPKLLLSCPNNCKVDNIPRNELTKHIDVCPLQFIQCKYHAIGCKAVMARKDQNKHNREMMEQHLSLSQAELAASQHTIHDLTQRLAIAEKEITTLKHQLRLPLWNTDIDHQAAKLLSGNEVLPVIVKMSEFTKKKRQRIECFSEPFFTQPNGYKMQMKVLPGGDRANPVTASHMNVSLYVMKGPYDDQLKWPMKGEYEVKLLNQKSNSMHHSVTCTVCEQNAYKPITERSMFAAWYSHNFISRDALTAAKYFLKDDNIYFQVCKP